MKVDAIVLAGSPNNGRLKIFSTASYEALIHIGQKSMVEYVIDALLGSQYIGKVVVVGPEIRLKGNTDADRVNVISPGENVLENVQLGMANLPAARRVLIVSSDIPLLTAKAVDDFIEQCADETVDLFYPIVSRNSIEDYFLNVKRTYVRLREGTFTGGNLFLLNPAVLPRCLDRGKEFIEARKDPLRLSRLMGIIFLIKFLLHIVSLKEAEVKVSGLFGIKGMAVISQYPGIGFDVDKPEDLLEVARLIG